VEAGLNKVGTEGRRFEKQRTGGHTGKERKGKVFIPRTWQKNKRKERIDPFRSPPIQGGGVVTRMTRRKRRRSQKKFKKRQTLLRISKVGGTEKKHSAQVH